MNQRLENSCPATKTTQQSRRRWQRSKCAQFQGTDEDRTPLRSRNDTQTTNKGCPPAVRALSLSLLKNSWIMARLSRSLHDEVVFFRSFCGLCNSSWPLARRQIDSSRHERLDGRPKSRGPVASC